MSPCDECLTKLPDKRVCSVNLAFVIASHTAGGIGPACRYLAEAIAQSTPWQVSLVSLHDPVAAPAVQNAVTVHSLGLAANTAQLFLAWLNTHPQDVLITGGVSGIEDAYAYLPSATAHVLQIHDSAARYRAVASRHAPSLDAVTCVGGFYEETLRRELAAVEFNGRLRTIHNGARFPALLPRQSKPSALRLLYLGRMEPQKGVFDFPRLLARLRQRNVPVTLTLAGGTDDDLARAFARHGVADCVTWTGRVPHADCYRLASESDVVLLLTRKEAFGMTAIEAMSMGCVPVAYDLRTGCREIIEHKRSGLLLPAGRLDLMAIELEQLHTHRDLLSILSRGAINRSRNDFGIDTSAKNMIDLVNDVMARRERSMPLRVSGTPPRTADVPSSPPRRGYQRLPDGVRRYAHRLLCAFPKLANYVYNR